MSDQTEICTLTALDTFGSPSASSSSHFILLLLLLIHPKYNQQLQISIIRSECFFSCSNFCLPGNPLFRSLIYLAGHQCTFCLRKFLSLSAPEVGILTRWPIYNYHLMLFILPVDYLRHGPDRHDDLPLDHLVLHISFPARYLIIPRRHSISPFDALTKCR